MDPSTDADRQPDTTPAFDEQLAHDLSLILMYLSSWTEHPGEAPRFWKGFRFEILNQPGVKLLLESTWSRALTAPMP